MVRSFDLLLLVKWWDWDIAWIPRSIPILVSNDIERLPGLLG